MGKLYREIIWQEKAPVVSVLYDCPIAKVIEILLVARKVAAGYNVDDDDEFAGSNR